MRYLWLAFLIGWNGSAYAAMGTSPSVDVPITISSSGPTPPPGAVAAGFTTLAANYDFTQTLPANWLGCYSSTGGYDNGPHQWYQGNFWHSKEPPCNISQAFDSVAGSNVLDLGWLPSYAGQGTEDEVEITTESHDTTQVTDFPPNVYLEIVARVSPLAANPTNFPQSGFWTWGTLASRDTNHAPIEWDILELYGASAACCDAAIHNWGNPGVGVPYLWQGSSSLPSGWDPTQYHTYAVRTTSDGSSVMSGCAYVDGNLIRCVNPQAIGAEFNLRNYILLWNGSSTQQLDMYVKSVHVWSCANWQTTMCNGTVLTGAP
jgi:hypothetical protein